MKQNTSKRDKVTPITSDIALSIARLRPPSAPPVDYPIYQRDRRFNEIEAVRNSSRNRGSGRTMLVSRIERRTEIDFRATDNEMEHF